MVMQPSAQKGFTLIEMMITVVILIIVSGVSVAAMITFNQNQGSEDDIRRVLTELRRTHSKATGVSYPSGTCTSLSGYRLTIPSPVSSKDISVTALCTPTSIIEERVGVLRDSYFSGSEVSFTINAGDGRVIPITPASPPVIITITASASDDITRQIEVKNNGIFELL